MAIGLGIAIQRGKVERPLATIQTQNTDQIKSETLSLGETEVSICGYKIFCLIGAQTNNGHNQT